MGYRSTLLVAWTALAGFLALLLLTEQWGVGPERQGVARYPYLLEDVYDRSAYQKRGRWAASGATPYLQEFSEYPQFTTWLMGLPYAFFDHGVERGEPYRTRDAALEYFIEQGVSPQGARAGLERLGRHGLTVDPSAFERGDDHPAAEIWRALRGHPGIDRERARAHLLAVWQAYADHHAELKRNWKAYSDLHHVIMGVLFALLFALVIANLRLLGAPPWLALLLLLPGTLYFGFNRHDLPVTVLVALALHLQLRARFVAAGFVLGVAMMTKWYPLVLMPLFLSHGFWHAWRPREGAALAFNDAFERRVLAPGLAATAVVLAALATTFVWHGGGKDAVLAVYKWHATVRVPNHASLLGVLSPIGWDWLPWRVVHDPAVHKVLLALQLLPPFAIALLPLRSRAALLEAAILATCGMVVFSKFFSPQWVLWIVALALLRARERRVYLVLVILLQIAIYLQLPVTFYASGAAIGEMTPDAPFHAATNARVALLFAFQAAALWGLVQALRTGPRPAPAGAAAARPAE